MPDSFHPAHALQRIVVAAIALFVAVAVSAGELDFLDRGTATELRVMSQNAGSNSAFPGRERGAEGVEPRHERFARVVRAIAPDVICFQEVFPPQTENDVAAMLDRLLPLEGMRWQAHRWSDNVIASRFPLQPLEGYEAVHGSRGPRGHAVALVQVPSAGGARELGVVCTHMDSRAQMGARLKHTAALLESVVHARGESLRPALLMGDLNAYYDDNAPHVAAMLAWAIDGEIVLRDAEPRVNASGGDRWTFKMAGTRLVPAALDRVLFTSAGLALLHGFVLDTTSLPDEALASRGLRTADVMRDPKRGRHDHLPVVADFAFRH